MDDFLNAVRILHRQIVGRGINRRNIDAPAFIGIGKGLLQFDKFGEVGVVERIGLAQVTAGVELVVPDASGLP